MDLDKRKSPTFSNLSKSETWAFPRGDDAMISSSEAEAQARVRLDCPRSITPSSDNPPSSLPMGSRMQAAALPCLSLMLLLWSQLPGARGQEFRFGSCRAKGVVLQELWEAFWAVKDAVQAQDNITSVRLLRREVLQDVSDAESCHLIHSLLKFYLNTVFKHYYKRAVELRTLKSFSTLANNFIVIKSQLQPSQDNEMFSISESAHRRFLLFQRAFTQLDIEAALTKAFGEVDILLTWMERFYHL
ncbi:interleukin-24 [Eulemur rufifrons]|uniref:interleukin-24 n=1 Tax=Eulemur rufifrons TaxID=859984 RepID=UPI0037433464